MKVTSTKIQKLIEKPGESLSIELKTWINPNKPEDIAKIAKAAIALRNNNGGYLVIGFNNETLKPDFDTAPSDVRARFHIDKIQGIISKYASEPFEISIEYPQYEGQEFPVIVIPVGVKTPVAAKSELVSVDDKRKHLIKTDCVYVRSLSSNNTPSTTQATWKDWSNIVNVCFDNREADIGRFFRRHLGGLTPEHLRSLALAVNEGFKPKLTTEDLLKEYIRESEERYESVIKERGITLPEFGTWEVALIIVGEVPQHAATQDFLNLLNASNPAYTGWPVWLDMRRLGEKAQLRVFKGLWEALSATLDSSWYNHVDFMRMDPKGRFYLKRALEDDLPTSERAPKPMTVLDFSLVVFRTVEAIAVGIEFAKAMGCEPEKTTLAFAFKWTGLHGRELSSWAQRHRRILERYSAYQNEVLTFLNVPLETPLSALAQYVNQVTQQLFQVFAGYELDMGVVEELTRQLIERRI